MALKNEGPLAEGVGEVIDKITKKRKKLPNVVETEERRTIQTKYIFTAQEKSDLASKMAQRQLELVEKTDERKTVMAGFNDTIKRINLDISKLSRAYRDGWEFREVECTVVYDYKKREKKFKDIYTKKIVDTQPFNPDDDQRKFI